MMSTKNSLNCILNRQLQLLIEISVKHQMQCMAIMYQ